MIVPALPLRGATALLTGVLLSASFACEDVGDSSDESSAPRALEADAVTSEATTPPLSPQQTPGPQCTGGTQENLALIGFATLNGGTTGGKGGTTRTIRTGTELVQALKDKKKNSAPLTLLIAGTITPGNAGVDKIDIKEIKNLSLIGAGAGATFDGIGIKINKSSNIVIRNLRVQKVRAGDKDAISIEGPVDHVWVDHCELSAELDGVDKDFYDGLLDTKAESAYLTYSWNYLHDSWKAVLVGSSESDTFDRKLTIHHNRFERCNSRLPLFRGGTGHVFNNYYKDVVDTGINSRIGACLRVEGNVFVNVKSPWISAFSDKLGAVETSCNDVKEGSTFVHDEERREPLACKANIPYDYRSALNHADNVAAVVTAHAGVGKLADPTAF